MTDLISNKDIDGYLIHSLLGIAHDYVNEIKNDENAAFKTWCILLIYKLKDNIITDDIINTKYNGVDNNDELFKLLSSKIKPIIDKFIEYYDENYQKYIDDIAWYYDEYYRDYEFFEKYLISVRDDK